MARALSEPTGVRRTVQRTVSHLKDHFLRSERLEGIVAHLEVEESQEEQNKKTVAL
jgi:hypothetical protein